MDIGSILNQAGGAGAIARELGVDQGTVERGAGALAPHVANGIEAQGLPGEPEAAMSGSSSSAGGGGMLGGLLGGALGGGGLMSAGAGTGGILGSLMGGGGNQVLSHIFGSKDKSRDVAAQASQESGVDSGVLKKLLPIVAGAVALHYATQGRHGGGGGAGGGGGGLLGSVLGGFGGR